MLDIFISGGPVMYPLLACSIIMLTVIIERIFFWISMDMCRNKPLVDEVLELCRAGDWESVRLKTKESKDYIIRILIAGILHRDFSMTKAMESAAADEIKLMRRYNGVLDTMITVAPLLGIFGTVLGIITSFERCCVWCVFSICAGLVGCHISQYTIRPCTSSISGQCLALVIDQ